MEPEIEKLRRPASWYIRLHSEPSVDGDLDTPRDLQVGADDRHVPTGDVVHKEPDRCPDVIEAPLEAAQHISQTLFSWWRKDQDQRDLPKRTRSTAWRCMTFPMLGRGRGPGGPSGELGHRQEANRFTLGEGGHN